MEQGAQAMRAGNPGMAFYLLHFAPGLAGFCAESVRDTPFLHLRIRGNNG
jgi:hypothetical protein